MIEQPESLCMQSGTVVPADCTKSSFEGIVPQDDNNESEMPPNFSNTLSLLKEEHTVLDDISNGAQDLTENALVHANQTTVRASLCLEESPVLVESVATQQEVFIIPNRESYKLRNADPLPALPERKVSANSNLDETQDSESSHLQAYCEVERTRNESFSEQDYEPIARFRKISAQRLMEESRKRSIPEMQVGGGEPLSEPLRDLHAEPGAEKNKQSIPQKEVSPKLISRSESIDSDPIYRPFELDLQVTKIPCPEIPATINDCNISNTE